MTIRNFQHLQPPPSFGDLIDVQVYSRKLFDALFRLMQGKSQNVAEVTLTANSATTVFNDIRLSIQTAILFDPRTANAATEYHGGTMYILDANRGKGTCTITHANNAQVDRTFFVAFVG
jgi:hypothetical protein